MRRFVRNVVLLFSVCVLIPCAADALEPKTHTLTLSPEAGYYDLKRMVFCMVYRVLTHIGEIRGLNN